MPATTSAWTSTVLHTVFGRPGGEVEDQTLVMDLADKRSSNVPGGQSITRGVTLVEPYGYTSSGGYAGVYPDAGDITMKQAVISPIECKYRIQWDRPLFQMTTPTGAFMRSATEMVEITKLATRKWFEICALGDGLGVVAKTEGALTNSATMNLEYHGGTTKTVGALGSRNLSGMRVAVGTAAQLQASPPTGDVTTITSISDSDTVNVSPNVTVADGDLVVVTATSTVNTYDNVIEGLETFTKQTGTYLGISRTTYERWKGGAVIAAGTVAPSVAHFRQLQSTLLTVKGKSTSSNGVGPVTVFITSPSVWDYVAATGEAATWFQGGGGAPRYNFGVGGGLTYDNQPVKISIQCKTDRIYGLDLSSPDALVLYKWGGWEPRVPGLNYLPVGENNQIETDMYCLMELATLDPRSLGVVTELDPTITKVWG